MGAMLALFLCQCAAAVTITASPTQIESGDQVTVTMADLDDGSTFSIQIQAEFDASPGEEFSFATTSFVMPVSLSGGEISAYTKNTVWTALEVRKGYSEVRYMDGADDQGIFQTTQSQDISRGTYDYLKLRGETRADASAIIARFGLTGTKDGPEDSTISFYVTGIDAGTVRITVTVDGTRELDTVITVGETPTPTPSPAPTPDPGPAPGPGGSAPDASFTANVTSGPAPLAVRFTDTSTENPHEWSWDFGDGEKSTEQHPVHTYTDPGEYDVQLAARNSYGTDITSRSGYISVEEPSPVLSEITLSPSQAVLQVGEGRSLSATGRDSDGSACALTGADWSSGNTSVATVTGTNGSARLTAIAAGETVVTVALDGVSATGDVRVYEDVTTRYMDPGGILEKSGMVSAIGEYREGTITTGDLVRVLKLYFG